MQFLYYIPLKKLLLSIFVFYSCSSSQENDVPQNVPTIRQQNNEQTTIKLNNPALFMGSTFGEFMQILHKTGEYNTMLTYTAGQTVKKFGKTELLHFYQKINFSYPLTLKAYKANQLHYQTTINATQKTIQIPVVIENDTCKLILNQLNINQPFVGM